MSQRFPGLGTEQRHLDLCRSGADAIPRARYALRLSPIDHGLFYYHAVLSLAHYAAGEYDDAIEWGRISRENPEWTANLRYLAAALAAANRRSEAREVAQTLQVQDPTFRVSTYGAVQNPFRDKVQHSLHLEHLQLAGLPEDEVGQVGTASITLNGECVAMTRSMRNPDFTSSGTRPQCARRPRSPPMYTSISGPICDSFIAYPYGAHGGVTWKKAHRAPKNLRPKTITAHLRPRWRRRTASCRTLRRNVGGSATSLSSSTTRMLALRAGVQRASQRLCCCLCHCRFVSARQSNGELPTRLLCTLRPRCRRRRRNTRCQAGATPCLGWTCTGWIAPASPGAPAVGLVRRGRPKSRGRRTAALCRSNR